MKRFLKKSYETLLIMAFFLDVPVIFGGDLQPSTFHQS